MLTFAAAIILFIILLYSNVHLLSTQPSLTSQPNKESFSILPSLSTATLASAPQFIPSFLQLSSSSLLQDATTTTLPPLAPLNTSFIATPLATDRTRHSVDIEPLSDSSLNHILRAVETKKIDSKPQSVDDNKSVAHSKRVLRRVTSLSTDVSDSSPQRKTYIVSKSESCDRSSSTLGRFLGKSVMKRLPIERLASIMKSKSKEKQDVSLNEAAFRIPRHTRRKLKPVRAALMDPQSSRILEPKLKGPLADNSSSLLQSNKKLTSKVGHWSGVHKRVHPIASQKGIKQCIAMLE